jgi:mono/diheme cytochrome c family protein
MIQLGRKFTSFLGFVSLFGGLALGQSVLPGDARNGEAVFRSQNCVTCHSVNGEGGRSAPDLGKRTARDYSPSTMTGLMWNHAPAMWSAMEKQGTALPKVTQQQAADLFAYFFASRYFEKPGDASRGRRLFVEKHCGDCHGISTPVAGGGPPVSSWTSLSDAITMAQQMWSHAGAMKAALEQKKVKWPSLTSQDLTDILVYLQNLPQSPKSKAEFSPASAQTGETLFKVKGCVGCHHDRNTLEHRFGQRTLTDFASAMWNHAPQMVQPPPQLSGDEMRRIVGYLWSVQFFDERGSADKGMTVFAKKQCTSCHGSSRPVPSVQGPFTMVAGLWQHGPQMLAQMKEKRVPWPRFKDTEMPDLIAFLKSSK